MRGGLAGALTIFAAGVILVVFTLSADPVLVGDATAHGRIVVAEDPPRSVVLAARELQTFIEKISGARLEIASSPGEADSFTVYVGQSRFTDELGVTDEGLEYGAYRMVSGDNWLVLLGRDADFELPQPYSLQPAADHPDTLQMLAEWDDITGGTYLNPIGGPALRKHHSRSLDLWAYDQRGSLNAVYGFLRRLGVRWYMPGELGEVVPELRTIRVEPVDEGVKPDFAWRQVHISRFGQSPDEEVLWYLRQGFNHEDVVGHYSHGLREVMGRPEMERAHPEYYALLGGERRLGQGSKNLPCLSSPGLVEETVLFARAMYDTYDVPMVSVMPQDGFRFCQCELCEGRDTPERGRLGLHSDYVWNFVEKVARELYKSHPDKWVTCGAYGTYTLPPLTIESFSPNVAALFVHGRGKRFHFSTEGEDEQEQVEGLPVSHPAFWSGEQLVELRSRWLEKLHKPILNWEHYVFTHRGTFTPVYFPRSIAAGLASMKGEVYGEFVEVAFGPWEVRGMGLHQPGFNHLNIYVTGRYYWDAEQGLEALLAEYFELFYGPSAEAMQAFVDYSELHWRQLEDDPERIQAVFERLDRALAQAPPGSVYAQRIQLVADYLQPLRFRLSQLQRGRQDVTQWRLNSSDASAITFDGRLEESLWQELAGASLSDAESGERATPATVARVFWSGGRLGGELWVGIRCERQAANDEVASRSAAGAFEDEYVSVLIETQGHSFYEIAVRPDGEIADIDHQGQQRNLDWSSMAVAETHVSDEFWSAEIRIPIPGADTLGDPLHEIAGRRPTLDFPWFINIVRQHTQDGEVTTSVWSTAPDADPYDPMHFGKLGARR